MGMNTATKTATVTVYLTNFGYTSQTTFASVDDALVHAKAMCFQVQVYDGKDLAATWCPIGGTRRFAVKS